MAWVLALANAAWGILVESAGWIVVSLALGGVIHEFLPTSALRRQLNRPGQGATAGAVLLGALLPICSCGVIPLAVSLYRAGVRLGPVMAFAAATPIINPAAVIMSYALLGPALTAAYVTLGLGLPWLLALLCDRYGDQRRARSGMFAITPAANVAVNTTVAARIMRGLRWGIIDLGTALSFYLAIGIALGAILSVLVPPNWIDEYLGTNSIISLLAAAVLGASIYVCAVAHIPLVATLLVAGATPGLAIVFLVTGTATNLPELFALYKAIGRRTVIIYVTGLVLASVLAGLIVNALLLPGFKPVFDPATSIEALSQAEAWQFSFPLLWQLGSAVLIAILALWGIARWLQRMAPLLGLGRLRKV